MVVGLAMTSVVMGGFAILGLVADYVWPAIVRVHNSRMAVVRRAGV